MGSNSNEAVDQSQLLGWVLGNSGLVKTEEDHLLHELGSSDTRRRRAARGYVAGSFLARGEERKRLEIGDQCIGYILHHAKHEDDELWPPQVIRNLFEKLRIDNIELGLEIAERNSRSVTSRSPTAGGEQERQIMARYLAQAQKVQLKWPRAARMLRRIAQAYASEASMNDRDAELREDRW